jgi:hypothetical protein
VKGFSLNCGFWAGVMLAPEAGKRITDLITGKMKPEDNPLRPTRYADGIIWRVAASYADISSSSNTLAQLNKVFERGNGYHPSNHLYQKPPFTGGF